MVRKGTIITFRGEDVEVAARGMGLVELEDNNCFVRCGDLKKHQMAFLWLKKQH